MLTLGQRIKILPIKVFLYIIWVVDSLNDLPETVMVNSTRAAAVVLVVSFFFPNTYPQKLAMQTRDQLAYLPDGIVANYYTVPNNNVQSTNVLGISKKAEELPNKVRNISPPLLTAKSVLVMDVGGNKVLYSFEADTPLAPASTTKLMTALVALDIYNMDDVLTTPSFCTTVESSRAGLVEDERISVNNLLKSLLVASAGDSACVLATSKVSYTDFVSLMNAKAKSLGMESTFFTNPIGLDGVERSHFSTAGDLYTLSKAAMRNTFISELVRTKEFMFGNITLYNTNKLLWEIPETVGIKTGTTQEAGEVLVYEYRDESKDLIIVVMGSEDRFGDTKKLLEWTKESYAF